jgi:hypothetical protein
MLLSGFLVVGVPLIALFVSYTLGTPIYVSHSLRTQWAPLFSCRRPFVSSYSLSRPIGVSQLWTLFNISYSKLLPWLFVCLLVDSLIVNSCALNAYSRPLCVTRWTLIP